MAKQLTLLVRAAAVLWFRPDSFTHAAYEQRIAGLRVALTQWGWVQVQRGRAADNGTGN